MPYSLRKRSSPAANAIPDAPVPAPKKSKGVTKTTAISKKTATTGFVLRRPSLPLSDAKDRVIKELARLGVSVPSEVKSKSVRGKPKVVHRALDLAATGSIRQSAPTDAKTLGKIILSEVTRLASVKPSEIKARVAHAPVKLAMQTEIIKRAVVSELKRRHLKSPIQTPRQQSPIR